MLARYAARLCAGLLLLSPLPAVAAAPAGAAAGAAAADRDGWSRPRALEPRGDVTARGTSFATNRSGRAVVSWIAASTAVDDEGRPLRTDLRARRVSRTGRLGPARTLYSTPHDVSEAVVAMDAAGDLVVGWTEYRLETGGSRPWVRRVPRRGPPTPPQLVWGESSETSISAVATTPGGAAAVTWLEPRTDANGATLPRRMLLRRVRADGSLSPVTDLGMTGITAPLLAGDDAFWVSGVVDPLDGSGSSGGIGVVRVSTRGRIEARRTLDPARTDGTESSYPRLTLDAREDARVLWTRYDSVHGGNEIVGRVWRARGSLSRPVVVRSGAVAPFSLATDGRGSSFVTWTTVDTNDFEGFGRRWDRRGRLGPVQRFGPVADEQVLSFTEVHGPGAWLDDSGRGVVLWGRRLAEGHIVTQVRRIRSDGRTSRLSRLDLGRFLAATVTPVGTVLATFLVDGRPALVRRR